MNAPGLELSTRHLYPTEGFSRPPVPYEATANRMAASVAPAAPRAGEVAATGLVERLAAWLIDKAGALAHGLAGRHAVHH